MTDTTGRFKNRTFDLSSSNGGITWERVPIAVLYDIRDELQKLNALLHCHNFVAIPQKLDAIKRNTTKKRKPKKAAPKLRVVGGRP